MKNTGQTNSKGWTLQVFSGGYACGCPQSTPQNNSKIEPMLPCPELGTKNNTATTKGTAPQPNGTPPPMLPTGLNK